MAIDKKIRDAINADIDASTIPSELKACYLLSNALQLLVDNSFERIKAVFNKHGVITNRNNLLTGITDYCKMVRSASWQFFNRIEPEISGATFEIGHTPEEGAELYDNFSDDANEICRLLLLYMDRTWRNDEWRKVFTLLRKMQSTGLFNDEDFTRFKQK